MLSALMKLFISLLMSGTETGQKVIDILGEEILTKVRLIVLKLQKRSFETRYFYKP